VSWTQARRKCITSTLRKLKDEVGAILGILPTQALLAEKFARDSEHRVTHDWAR